MGKFKYPYIPDKNLFVAVKIAEETLTHGKLFRRAVEWAADKMNVDADDVSEYLSRIFNDCQTENDDLDQTEILERIDELTDRALSNVYWCEGDGEANDYLYNIEEKLDEIKRLINGI